MAAELPASAKRLRRGKAHAQPSRSGVTSKARPQGSPLPRCLFLCDIAEGKHPIPVSCIGQAPCLPSVGWMRLPANTATDYFRSTGAAWRDNSANPIQGCVFHNLFPTSPLRYFPLRFYVGKIDYRRTKRVVSVHSLSAKITWLKHCRNLGHAKLTAARGQL